MRLGYVVGQRWRSESEPELGLGTVAEADRFRVKIKFPAAGEERIYAAGASVLKRVTFRVGEVVKVRGGVGFTVETAEEIEGLWHYAGEGKSAVEGDLTDAAGSNRPLERLMAGQVEDGEAFALRREALEQLHTLRSSPLRGFFGGRVELLPHQFYLLQEVSSRQLPRVLLADEVGLGKTIEACLILHRLRTLGRADRVLILVPEAILHQWFVELLRRFNLWFSLYDESRCVALETSGPGENPFLDSQLVLCATEYLANQPERAEAAIAAGWDLVIVDEAHHLEWSPEAPSPAYTVVEGLGKVSPGLLLLTATPNQLGVAGHFARLRLLDPDRYSDLATFEAESEGFVTVARIADRILEGLALTAKDTKDLRRIFSRDAEGLDRHLAAVSAGAAGAREALLQALLDEHGTGRVVFRNTRARMTGFPERVYCPAELPGDEPTTLAARLQREFAADAEGDDSALRYAFADDPRMEWLVELLKSTGDAKILLICRSRRKAVAIETALKEFLNVKVGLFHEELALVQRDRQAAWFAEADGARLLICSEIGSEGRNFQFAHHLVLWDLPLNPGLLEQRIGRLDRIGQRETIQIHVPVVAGSPQAFVARWYDEGLDAFRVCGHGGAELAAEFGERLQALAKKGTVAQRKALITATKRFREALQARLRAGRDRLLELNSFRAPEAEVLLEKLRTAEQTPTLRAFLFRLLDHFGVRVDEHEGGEVRLDPSRAYVEAFPSLPREGTLATFDRARALAREDIAFLSPDHPLIYDAMAVLLDGETGSTAFSICPADAANIVLEAVFVLEPVALTRLRVDRFLSPTPVRVVVDIRGRHLTEEYDPQWMRAAVRDGQIHRFLERPGFSRPFLEAMVGGAESFAEGTAADLKESAREAATSALEHEIDRLEALQRVNPAVRPEEIEATRTELAGILDAIDSAGLRLDSLRLIVEGDVTGLE